MSVPRGRPRAEPREVQRARLVAAARAAFTERGYEAVTLSGVATEAAVPRAAVYEVIGTKLELLGAVADEVADELIAAVDREFAEPATLDQPLSDMIRAEVGWWVRLLASDPSYLAVVRLSGRLATSADDPANRARRRLEDRISELHVARAEREGVEREASARALSVATLALLERVSLRAGEEGWDIDAVADLLGQFTAGGYLRAEGTASVQAFEDGHPS